MAHIPAVTFARCRFVLMNKLMTTSKEVVISCSFIGSAEQIIGAYAVKVGKLYERGAWYIIRTGFISRICCLAYMKHFRKLSLL